MPVASGGLPGQSQFGVHGHSQVGIYLFLSSKSGNGPGSFSMEINGVIGLGQLEWLDLVSDSES